jgi:hypothetical protein
VVILYNRIIPDMKHLILGCTALLILAVLFSCSDSLFGTGEDKSLDDIAIKSLKPGGLLKKGQGVTFSIISPGGGELPDRLLVNLSAMNGENLKKLETKDFTLNNDLALDPFDSIKTGQYKLEFAIYSGETLIASKTISFFYVESDFEIQGVESFPSGIYPGAHVLLRSSLKVPVNSDPFLRWTQGDKIIARGLASEGKGKIIWTAPDDEGVYTMRVELFPVGPNGAEDYGFTSVELMDFEIFVSRLQSPSRLKLLPESSYYSLFHLDGNFADSGAGINKSASMKLEKPKAFPIGNPEVITKDDDLGYRLDGTSGFTVPYCIFPVTDGRLAPFTLSMGLDVGAKQTEKRVFSYISQDDSFDLDITLDSFSNVAARMRLGAQTFELPTEINLAGIEKRFLLSLSVIPASSGMIAEWYIDGIKTNTVNIDASANAGISVSGVATVGGTNGFSGTIDEIGTYYMDSRGRSSVDPGLYRSAMYARYQSELVLAEGFEGLFVPDFVIPQGKAWMDGGGLTFESEVSFTIENLPKNNAPFSVALDFLTPVDEMASIELSWNKSEKPFLTVGADGKIRAGAKEAPKHLSGASKSVRATIHENDTLVSFGTDKLLRNLRIESPEDRAPRLTIKIKNTDPKKPAVLDTITVIAEKK